MRLKKEEIFLYCRCAAGQRPNASLKKRGDMKVRGRPEAECVLNNLDAKK